MDHDLLGLIINRVLAKLTGYSLLQIHPQPLPVGVSNRHLHLSAADLETLFGAGYQLQRQRDLQQPGQFVAAETVNIAGPKGCIEKARILGPVRKQTQVEISRSDGYKLGLNPPVRESGNLQGSSGVTIIGPRGAVYLNEGLIVARRHIHMSPDDAVNYGVADGDILQISTNGERSLVFDQVTVRVNPKFILELHLDIDEANAAGINQGDLAHLLTDPSKRAVKNKGSQPQAEKKPTVTPLSLITEDNVRSAWKNKAPLHARKNAITTPLARDTIKDLGVEIVWSDLDE